MTIPFDNDIVAEAQRLVKLGFDQPRPILIHSLDAIHISSALASKAKALVATDRRLREIAALARLKVMP